MAKVNVLYVYEEKEDQGGFARAFGIDQYEIDDAILKKHGKLVSKSNPDILSTFLHNIERKARDIFGI